MNEFDKKIQELYGKKIIVNKDGPPQFEESDEFVSGHDFRQEIYYLISNQSIVKGDSRNFTLDDYNPYL